MEIYAYPQLLFYTIWCAFLYDLMTSPREVEAEMWGESLSKFNLAEPRRHRSFDPDQKNLR